METAEATEEFGGRERLTPEQIAVLRRKESLLLSRSRVLHDLEKTSNTRYRQMLSEALAHLEHELVELG